MERLPKLCGGDIELGNFVLGLNRGGNTCYEASRAVLRHIEGLPRQQGWGWGRSYRQSYRQDWAGSYPYGYGYGGGYSYYDSYGEWGRKFLPCNGGCVYIDLDHLELCLPEVLNAWDHVAAWHAMLRIARRALVEANQQQPPGQRICVLVNNSDGQGNSYGSHLDFLITRRAWDNLFYRKLHQLLFLASYQVSSVIFTGQGKVGSENGAPPARFQLSQRADFFEMLVGPQTTYRRPLVNSRDEPLCGYQNHAARMHVIFFDSTLAEVACLLKVGVMQILLAMIEAGRINPNLILDDPLAALLGFSHDPTLEARARTAGGSLYTALELQCGFLEEARRFVEKGGCEGIVPRAGEITALWGEMLAKLQARDLPYLARRLDWVLKLTILERVMRQDPKLNWSAPQIKHLDHMYSSLDPSEGLFWAYQKSGLVERVVSERQVEHFCEQPPEDTRAWTRAMLLRAAPEAVEDVDWDRIRFRIRGPRYWPSYRTLHLDDPLGWTRQASKTALTDRKELEEILDALQPQATYELTPAAGATGGTSHEFTRPLRSRTN